MGLTNVWVRTLGDGLVRADQVVGIDAHQTPVLSGKPTRWLLDVIASVPAGSGNRESWIITALHHTVIQTDDAPGDAPSDLAKLLAALDARDAAGIVSAEKGAGGVRFEFEEFVEPPPRPAEGPDTEYL